MRGISGWCVSIQSSPPLCFGREGAYILPVTGMDATANTRTLALQLAVGRFLNHILDVMEYQGGGQEAADQKTTPPWAAIDNHPPPAPGTPNPRLFLYSGENSRWTKTC